MIPEDYHLIGCYKFIENEKWRYGLFHEGVNSFGAYMFELIPTLGLFNSLCLFNYYY